MDIKNINKKVIIFAILLLWFVSLLLGHIYLLLSNNIELMSDYATYVVVAKELGKFRAPYQFINKTGMDIGRNWLYHHPNISQIIPGIVINIFSGTFLTPAFIQIIFLLLSCLIIWFYMYKQKIRSKLAYLIILFNPIFISAAFRHYNPVVMGLFCVLALAITIELKKYWIAVPLTLLTLGIKEDYPVIVSSIWIVVFIRSFINKDMIKNKVLFALMMIISISYYIVITKFILIHPSLSLFYPKGVLSGLMPKNLFSGITLKIKYLIWLFIPLGIAIPFLYSKRILFKQLFWAALPLMCIHMLAYDNHMQIFDPTRWYHYSWYAVLMVSFVNGVKVLEETKIILIRKLAISLTLVFCIIFTIIMNKTMLKDLTNPFKFAEIASLYKEKKEIYDITKDKIVIGQWCLLPFLTNARELYHLGETQSKKENQIVDIVLTLNPKKNSYPLSNSDIISIVDKIHHADYSVEKYNTDLYIYTLENRLK